MATTLFLLTAPASAKFFGAADRSLCFTWAESALYLVALRMRPRNGFPDRSDDLFVSDGGSNRLSAKLCQMTRIRRTSQEVIGPHSFRWPGFRQHVSEGHSASSISNQPLIFPVNLIQPIFPSLGFLAGRPLARGFRPQGALPTVTLLCYPPIISQSHYRKSIVPLCLAD